MSDKKGGASDALMGWGILACVFGAIGYLVWWHFDAHIRSAIRWIRYGEMWVASWFVGSDYTVTWRDQQVKFDDVMAIASRMPADKIDGDFLSLLSTVTMTPYLFIIVPITLVMALWSLMYGPGSEHRTTFDLNGLIKRQASNFPAIAPLIHFNPTNQPPRPPGAPVPAELPLFAEALAPEEWVVFNEIPVIDKQMDEEAATKAFTRQLGARWRGAKYLEPYQQVLLACFCLKASRKRADSDTMLGKLAACWHSEKGLKIDRELLREARAVLGNKKLSESVLKKCSEHAWVTTALLRGLNTAREEGGVLAPAQFVWLRGHNRVLWYPLNNLGRQSFHMEALGAIAHYKAEKMARRPIPRPKMSDPVKSLNEYLRSDRVRALPEMDYSMTKKRGVKKLKTA